jgi:NADPH:quinone reductase-like Zn-dependent oxidoreductase
VRAIAIEAFGGPDRLQVMDLPVPPVAPDGVLVRVRAAGVNPVDVGIREGRLRDLFPYHFPLVPGWDAAGVVERVGPAVTDFRPGDEVYGYCRMHHIQWGTYAEYVSVPESFLAHKPRSLSFEEAAAMPLAALTAHQSLDALGVRGGEAVFVAGGAGGVGHFAVQLAVDRAARVMATASERNHGFLRELGAEPLLYESPDVGRWVREMLASDGADAAVDLFGGLAREQAFCALRQGGRLASVASPPPEARPGYEVHYVFVRPHGEELAWLAQLVAEAKLRPVVEEVFPLERAADAQERITKGHVRGKLVLRVD